MIRSGLGDQLNDCLRGAAADVFHHRAIEIAIKLHVAVCRGGTLNVRNREAGGNLCAFKPVNWLKNKEIGK